MNKTNQALMGTLIGIALVCAVLSFVQTVMNINDGNFSVTADLLGLFSGSAMPESIHNAYWDLIGLYTDPFGNDSGAHATILLFTVGFALVAAGCASRATRDLKGSADDPQEYLFTHRPKAFLRCLMIPWNMLTAAWGFKKVPVLIPMIFIPFMLPFALIMDIVLAVLFAVAWTVMNIRMKLAASKDRRAYDRDTRYAVCPKCKRKFYRPDVKCKCGLTLSYPVPNKYGVRYHTCNNGHKIPSTNADGIRAKIQTVCPYCKGEMFSHEARPLAVSMVGSAGSGKTTMMISAAESIAALAKEKGIVSEIITKGISADAQRGKSHVVPTPAGELDSEYFFLRARELPEKQVIINDISGLEFQPDRDKILFEEYYKYNNGIVLAIDPFEVMALYHSQSPTKGSKNTPVATLESFYHMYTEINGYGPAVRSAIPFAVVLTKMDDPKIRSSVDAEGTPADFLNKYGQKTIVDIVQSAFGNVKYFKVASLGDSANAAEPFAWILSENDEDLKTKLFG
ncbi:MAG: hypothetical protein LBJ20_03765 [Candidatus Methanoplasma sp.]|jgi:GTPase SAR1 family protein|nr:hypothetical protein [Candidatus Methanoplasma sp.]